MNYGCRHEASIIADIKKGKKTPDISCLLMEKQSTSYERVFSEKANLNPISPPYAITNYRKYKGQKNMLNYIMGLQAEKQDK